MATHARDPFIAYLLVHATMLRGHQSAPAAAALVAEHVNALQLLVDVVRDLPQDDERLLMLVTLAIRHGQFALARPPTMPSPSSLALRARCATPSSPPSSRLRATMRSGGRVTTEFSLPSGPAEQMLGNAILFDVR